MGCNHFPQKMREISFGISLFFIGLQLGCGYAAVQPGAGTTFELDPTQEINDDDVRKAFEAKPQMGTKAHFAYYSFDPEAGTECEGILKAWPGTQSVYRIPAFVATGRRRYDTYSPWNTPPVSVSIKKLRLLGARAHADVVVLFDYGHKVSGSPNGLIAFAPLLFPLLFLPFLEVSVESYLEAFIIDTRNGYLYGHITLDEKDSEGYLTIYSGIEKKFVEDQKARLYTRMRAEFVKIAESESSRAPAAAQKPAPSATEAPPLGAAPTAPPGSTNPM